MPEADWRQIVMDKYDALGVGYDNHRARTSIMVNVLQRDRALLVEAARQRDISLSAFMRRAGFAIASYDLGIPWGEITEKEKPLQRFGESKIGSEFRSGEGHGPWIINDMGVFVRG